MSARVKVLDILEDLWRDIDHAAGSTDEVLRPGIRSLQQVFLLPRDLNITASDEAICLDKILREGGGHCCQARRMIHSNHRSADINGVGMSCMEG